MTNIDKNIEAKKLVSFRADAGIIEGFDHYLTALREELGESVTKEAALSFLMEHALKLRPKEFLALYHAHKAEKFSKG